MWMPNIMTEESHRNYFFINSNRDQLDVNNNNLDTNLIMNQDTSNIKNIKGHVESKFLSSFHSNYIQIVTSDSYLSLSNNVIEQTEPIDLSCEKKKNSKTEKKKYYQAKSKDNFERNSEVPFSKNISESNLLILKNVYDIKYHQKPNCDDIFCKDPVNPDLNICKLCAKHVRSKWHHFQTHYSRDHRCLDCNAVYSRIDTLRTHAKKRHHTIIPRYYFGIPANVWHRVIIQCPAESVPRMAISHNTSHRLI